MLNKPKFWFAALALALAPVAVPTLAQDGPWQHASALVGTPKYPADFAHFDYVNPSAPVGGLVRLAQLGGFDSFNPIVPAGSAADGLGLVFETLMASSRDEVSTQYGLLADAMRVLPDQSAVTFRMNPRAKWSDGEPVTAEDVVWSFEKAKEVNPNVANYYANVASAEITAPGEVTFKFSETGNRELPHIMGQLSVMPKHWWEGTGADGKPRDIAHTTLEIPVGSGPYRVKSFDAGRTVTYVRNPDYWGKDDPVNIGSNNFETIRYEYFLDDTAIFEAFKADQFDWWSENLARRWQNDYKFPAVTDGRVVRELFENDYRGSGVLVGFIPNLRKPVFQNESLRAAILNAFDFESLDKLRFFGQYDRINSFFYGTEFASSGLPQGEELEILNTVKDQVPASVFTTEYTNPVSGDPQKLRANLRVASEMLKAAGYVLDGDQLKAPDGTPVTFEILLNGKAIEPVALPFTENLKLLGISATIRSVDAAQYVERVQKRDYDMIYFGWGQSLSPGNEQRAYWGSVSADEEGSSNHAGIADKAVDALIDKVIFADDHDTLVAATRALDRVLLAHHYAVPTYTLRHTRSARWDRFSHADPLPEFSNGFPTVWWYDEAKAAKTGAAQ